jgi:uncharacterized protein
MSERDVEVVRQALAAFNEGDIEAVLGCMDPDIEFVPLRALLEGSAYRGHDGFRRFVADMVDDWEDYHPISEEFRDVGDGRVLVLGRFHARGRASGVEVESPAAWVSQVRGGKIVRVRIYADEQSALASLGVS